MSAGAFEQNLAALNRLRAEEAAAKGVSPIEMLDAVKLLKKYNYQPELTAKIEARLDALTEDEAPNRPMIYEMILWKLSRFVWFDDAVLPLLRDARSIQPREHRQAEPLLRALLNAKGARLAMTSTFLRFTNPNTFQIIDERAIRMVLPDEKIPAPYGETRTEGYLVRCCDIYFRYLDALHAISGESLPFSHTDRVLYQLDKELGNGVGQSTDQMTKNSWIRSR
ncbi:hypothetical protein [Pandoraea bronchicola]|uniref:Uncharacterized protein n=1 Tax=Pandoraea bronchicola TaxID=2508287 RepID=A0A5E5BX27_9BURK|nr:hypothetical protein [Pandoraea bronchicola]VVE89876.1 hypothetical protein PBR20603_03849 [Pandoraea bronchicola]